jgi:hypothetical protein
MQILVQICKTWKLSSETVYVEAKVYGESSRNECALNYYLL